MILEYDSSFYMTNLSEDWSHQQFRRRLPEQVSHPTCKNFEVFFVKSLLRSIFFQEKVEPIHVPFTDSQTGTRVELQLVPKDYGVGYTMLCVSPEQFAGMIFLYDHSKKEFSPERFILEDEEEIDFQRFRGNFTGLLIPGLTEKQSAEKIEPILTEARKIYKSKGLVGLLEVLLPQAVDLSRPAAYEAMRANAHAYRSLRTSATIDVSGRDRAQEIRDNKSFSEVWKYSQTVLRAMNGDRN